MANSGLSFAERLELENRKHSNLIERINARNELNTAIRARQIDRSKGEGLRANAPMHLAGDLFSSNVYSDTLSQYVGQEDPNLLFNKYKADWEQSENAILNYEGFYDTVSANQWDADFKKRNQAKYEISPELVNDRFAYKTLKHKQAKLLKDLQTPNTALGATQKSYDLRNQHLADLQARQAEGKVLGEDVRINAEISDMRHQLSGGTEGKGLPQGTYNLYRGVEMSNLLDKTEIDKAWSTIGKDAGMELTQQWQNHGIRPLQNGEGHYIFTAQGANFNKSYEKMLEVFQGLARTHPEIQDRINWDVDTKVIEYNRLKAATAGKKGAWDKQIVEATADAEYKKANDMNASIMGLQQQIAQEKNPKKKVELQEQLTSLIEDRNAILGNAQRLEQISKDSNAAAKYIDTEYATRLKAHKLYEYAHPAAVAAVASDSKMMSTTNDFKYKPKHLMRGAGGNPEDPYNARHNSYASTAVDVSGSNEPEEQALEKRADSEELLDVSGEEQGIADRIANFFGWFDEEGLDVISEKTGNMNVESGLERAFSWLAGSKDEEEEVQTLSTEWDKNLTSYGAPKFEQIVEDLGYTKKDYINSTDAAKEIRKKLIHLAAIHKNLDPLAQKDSGLTDVNGLLIDKKLSKEEVIKNMDEEIKKLEETDRSNLSKGERLDLVHKIMDIKTQRDKLIWAFADDVQDKATTNRIARVFQAQKEANNAYKQRTLEPIILSQEQEPYIREQFINSLGTATTGGTRSKLAAHLTSGEAFKNLERAIPGITTENVTEVFAQGANLKEIADEDSPRGVLANQILRGQLGKNKDLHASGYLQWTIQGPEGAVQVGVDLSTEQTAQRMPMTLASQRLAGTIGTMTGHEQNAVTKKLIEKRLAGRYRIEGKDNKQLTYEYTALVDAQGNPVEINGDKIFVQYKVGKNKSPIAREANSRKPIITLGTPYKGTEDNVVPEIWLTNALHNKYRPKLTNSNRVSEGLDYGMEDPRNLKSTAPNPRR